MRTNGTILTALIVVFVTVGLAALIAVLVLIRQQISDTAQLSQQINQSNDVLSALNNTLYDVRDTETAQRGFIITGDRTFLKLASDEKTALKKGMRLNIKLARRSEALARALPLLEAKIDEKQQFQKEMIELREKAGFEAAARKFSTGRGIRLMLDIRKTIDSISRQEQDLIESRSNKVALRSKSAVTLLSMIIGFAAALFSLAFFLCLRYLKEQKQIDEELRQQNLELERRVQERTAELSRSNADLKQFAKIASHDLQGPLRTVQGYALLLEQRYGDRLEKDGTDFVNFILEAIEKMTELIQDVLRHSLVGKKADSLQQVSCSDIVREVLLNLDSTIKSLEAEVVCSELPAIEANRSQLLQLFQNLIDNAMKFHGAEPPKVLLTAEKMENEWLFSVQDNGIGIELEYMESVFEMFTRLHSQAVYGGSGIGLAICKKIVQSHGGRIWFDSAAVKGSTVRFTLPVSQQGEDHG